MSIACEVSCEIPYTSDIKTYVVGSAWVDKFERHWAEGEVIFKVACLDGFVVLVRVRHE